MLLGLIQPNKYNEKYVAVFGWLIVFITILATYQTRTLLSPDAGDELYYVMEADYLTEYGFMQSLAQGTSFVYTVLVVLFTKLFFTTGLIAARILSVVSFLICCVLLLRCLRYFPMVTHADRYLCLSFFAIACNGWLFVALADIVGMVFFLAGFLLILRSGKLYSIALAGVLFFMGFACKPVALLLLPGIVGFLFFRNLKNDKWQSAIKAAVLSVSFLASFAVYHLPGYNMYHKLMLEDKSHNYHGKERVATLPGRRELEMYYLTVPHKHSTVFSITVGEVNDYIRQHPEVNLNCSYADIITRYTGIWVKNGMHSLFFILTYTIQSGFFFTKWTVINKFIDSFFIIHILTLLLYSAICLAMRQYIKQSLLYFLIPFSFAVILAFYALGHYESNWLLLCTPFLALPVVKFLTKYANIYLLLSLQLLYIVTGM